MLGTTTMLVVVRKVGLIMSKGYRRAFGSRCMHSEEFKSAVGPGTGAKIPLLTLEVKHSWSRYMALANIRSQSFLV